MIADYAHWNCVLCPRLYRALKRYHESPLGSLENLREALRRRGAAVALALGLAACSSRPVLELPADAGSECADCWERCATVESRKAASFCSSDCGRLCEEEGR